MQSVVSNVSPVRSGRYGLQHAETWVHILDAARAGSSGFPRARPLCGGARWARRVTIRCHRVPGRGTQPVWPGAMPA